MNAALPLYDWPELRAETDAFRAALAARLRAAGLDAAEAPDRTEDGAPRDGALLFRQVCGLPYVRGAAGPVRLVATPCYAVEGCAGPLYSSAVIVRRGDARGMDALSEGVLAANDPGSMSGWLSVLDALGRPPRVVWTGAHRASVRAVAEGRADAAAIDAVAFALARRFEPAAAEVEVAGWTRRVPAPPFVTTAEGDAAERVRAALDATLADPAEAGTLRALGLSGARRLADADYDPIRALAAAHEAHLGPL